MLVLLLALCMAAPAAAISGDDGNIHWDLTDGTLTISGNGAMPDYSWNGAPWYSYRDSITTVVIEDGVTSIGSYAFRDCSSLTSIDLPSGVTSIGDYAFSGCSSLTSLTIPSGVTSIGYAVFADCSSITSINVDGGNTKYKDIDGILFSKDGTVLHTYPAGKSATSYTIPSNVTSIGSYAFFGCSSLTSISLPSGVTSIGYAAFSGCSSLISLTLPSGVMSVGDWAFSHCRSLTSLSIPSSVTSIGSHVFEGCSSLPSVTLPSGITSIGYGTFYGCSNLTSLTLPSGVTSIGERAFYGCSILPSIMLPPGVTSIGDAAFSNLAANSIIYCADTSPLSGKYSTDKTALAVKNADGSYSFTSDVTNLALRKANAPADVTYGGWFADEAFTKRVTHISAGTNPTLWLNTDNPIDEPIGNFIDIESSSPGISEKGKGYIDIAYYDANGNRDSDTLIRWRSDNPSVLGISYSTNTYADLQPRSTGKATIYAELASDPSVNASVTYTVEETVATSIDGWCSNCMSWVDVESTPGKKICTFEIIEGTEVYADVYDQYGVSLQYPDIRWEIVSGNENITLTQESNTDRYAKVVPTKAGSAEIKATSKLNTSLSLTFQIEIPQISEYVLDIRSDVTPNLTMDAYDGYASAFVHDTTYWHYFPEKRIKWSVDDESIVAVTVEKNYDYPTRYVTLTPKKVGTTVLRAELEDDPLVNDSVTITVEDTVVSSVYFAYDWDSDYYVDTTGSDWVYLTDQYGRTIRSDSGNIIEVKSSDSNVILLSLDDYSSYNWEDSVVLSSDSYFRIKAIGEGDAVITASLHSDSSITTSKNIHVSEYVPVDPEPAYDPIVSSIYINSPQGISNRSSPSISVTLRDAYGNYIEEYDYPKYYRNVEWTVDDKSVLTLSSNYGRSQTIIPNPNAVGKSTTIRAALKSDAAVYDEIKVTIAESVPTSVYINGETKMIVNPNRTYWVGAYVRDQFDNQLSEPVIWEVKPEILTITERSSSYSSDIWVTANAAGTAVITAYAGSNPSLSQSMEVMVEQPVLTELYVNAPEGISLTGSGTLDIWGYDQFGSSMSLSGCTVTVDNESVLTVVRQENQWSRYDEYYTLTPISEGTAVITVTYGSMAKSCTVKVEKGIPARISAYWLASDRYSQGNYADYLLLNSNYGTAYAYVYDQFGNSFGDTVRWIVDDLTIVDVSSTVSSSGSKIALFPKTVGKTTIHAVSTADESLKTSFTVRVYAEKPTNYTSVVVQGEDIFFSGESDASKLQYYIFGTNYFTFGTVDVVDGFYSKNVSSNGLAAGQYFTVIQNPGEDGNFSITAIGNEICSINAAGQKTVLFDVTYRQSGNAAQALCDAIQSKSDGGDDTYDEFSFIVTGPTSYINAIPSEISHGEILTISGTTTGHAGEVVVVELLSTAFAAVPKEIVGPASFVSQTTKIGSDGYWEINIDTSELNPDEYGVYVAVGDLAAVATKLTIVGESGVTPTPKKYTSVTSRSSPVPFNFPSGMRVENVYVTPDTELVAGQTIIVNADIRIPSGSCDISDYITFDTELTDSHLETTLKRYGRDFVTLKDTYRLDGFNLVYDYTDVVVHLRLVGSVDSSAAGTSISPLTITGNISGVSTIYSLPSMKVVSGTPLINPGHSDNYVFVYENAGLSGLWYSETSAVTFEDGYIIGSNVEEGLYSSGNQLTNILYPTAEVTAVSNSVSCLEKIVDKSSEITFGVASKVASYSVGNGLGLMFTAPDGTQTTAFGGVDFSYTNPDAFGTPVSVADAAEGTWHVQAYFNADGTSGHLVTDTPQRYQLGKDIFTFSVGHIGSKDALYAESKQDKYTIGDTIYLKGYNPTGKSLYLYMRGTNYPLTSLPLDSITGVNWEATIQTDELVMANGKRLDAGTYTIYIAAASGIFNEGDFDNSNICSAYTTVPVALKQPVITITSAPSKVAVGGTLTVKGVAEAAPKVQYYIFGENYYSFDSIDVIDNKFTITKSLTGAESGTYHVIVQHPMYDKEFNIWVEDSVVWMSEWNYRYHDLFSLDDCHGLDAALKLCQNLDSQNIDDMYAKFSFEISDGSGGEITNPTLTLNAPSDVLFGEQFIISGTSNLPETEVNIRLSGHSYGRTYSGITDADGNWDVTVDTAVLYADSYTITADVGSERIGCSVTVHAASFLKLVAPNEVALLNDGEYLTASIIKSPSQSGQSQPTAVPTLAPGQTPVSNYEYQIDNPDIFDLEVAGSNTWRIIPKTYGTANVTITWKENNSYTAVKQITVSEKNGVASITLDYNRRYDVDGRLLPGIHLTPLDESAWVYASAYDANGYSFRNEKLTFTSSDTGVIDVETESGSGNQIYIHLMGVGEAVLTAVSASNPDVLETVNVTVSEPELSVRCYNVGSDDTFRITNGSSVTLEGYVETQYRNSIASVDTWDIADDSVAELSIPQFNPYGITITALSIGETTLTMSSSKYPEVSKTVTVVVEDPTLKRVRIGFSGSSQLSLDAHNTLVVTAYDQYGYPLPGENVDVNIVNNSIIDLVPAEEDGTYMIVPKNVGTTEVIAAVKDKVNDFTSATITVEKTIPHIRGYLEPSGGILAENGILYYEYCLVDQFGNLLDWKLTPEIDIEDTNLVELSEIESMVSSYQMVKLVRNTSTEITDDTIVSLILKNETHGMQEIIPITLSKDSADFYGFEVYGLGYVTTDNQMVYHLPKISVEDGLIETYVDTAGKVGSNLCLIPTPEDFTASSSNEAVITITKSDSVTAPGDIGYIITPKKSGTATLTFKTGKYVLPVEVTVTAPKGEDGGLIDIAEPPEITSSNDENGLFTDKTTVTIKTRTEGAHIYYTTDGTEPTAESKLYSKANGFEISDTTVVKAIAVCEGYETSAVTTAVFTKYSAEELPTYNVTVVQTNGGTLTAVPAKGELSAVPYGTEVTITAAPDEGYAFTSWSITGESTGTVKEKTSKAKTFSVDSEDVKVSAVFTKVEDKTPKASSVKIVNIPKTIYKTDTGALNAVTYDQFGARFSDNKVTWSSSASDVIAINEKTGAYEAVACGYAVITAASTENPSVTAVCELSVYQPPTPYVNAKVVPKSAQYGIMSETFNVASTDATYLNWNWDDNTPVVKTLVAYPYPLFHTSTDAVAHTFAELGNLIVSVTPSNKYGSGAAAAFPVKVTYAPPRNVKIINGPSAVVAGNTVTYEAFATGYDGFVWYLDDIEQSGSTFTIPENYAGEHKVKVSAWKGDKENNTPAEKTIHVSALNGPLGDFGEEIKESPAYPAVGEVVVFSINAVSNATKYTWTFGEDSVTTTTPSVSYTLNDDSLNKVSVTAYNSADTASQPKEYTFTHAGYKPVIKDLTASPASSAPAGTVVTYTAAAEGSGLTYKWVVDGKTVSGETSGTYIRTWTDLEVKRHEVAVYVKNNYGEERMPITYTVTPRPNLPAVIEKINGPAILNENLEGTYSVEITSTDAYTVAWYVDNVLQTGKTGNEFAVKLGIGEHVIKLVATTSAEEISEKEKTVVVISSSDWDKNTADSDKSEGMNPPAEEDQVNPRVDEDENTDESVISTVGTITLGKDDVSEDAEKVNLVIKSIKDEELAGFTSDMGSTSDAVMSLSITPTGLKNEKDLQDAALLTFRIAKMDVTGPKSVKFYRLDTGSSDGIDKWVELPIVSHESDKNYWVFTVKTSGFSDFVGVDASYKESTSSSSQPSGTSHSSSQGTSVWQQATAEPTAAPTQAAEPTQAEPTASPVNQPRQETSTPAPFIGILAGLGAAGLLFALRRK